MSDPTPSFCASCGATRPATARYCPSCGAAFDVGIRPEAEAAGWAEANAPSGAPVQHASPTPRVPRRRSPSVLALLTLVVIGGLALLLLNSHTLLGGVESAVTPSCTVGLAGAAVSVTVQGLTADGECQSMLSQVTAGGSWYEYGGGQVPAGALICQAKRDGDLFTVRDSGALALYGNGICQSLLSTPVPTVAPPAPAGGQGGYDVCGLALSDHDAGVIVNGPSGSCAEVEQALSGVGSGSWSDQGAGVVDRSGWVVCSGTWQGISVEVRDTGGQFYGGQACDVFGLAH